MLSLIGIFVIGNIDYLTGYRISLLVFYILPIGFATIYVGPRFATSLALLSICVSVASDYRSGMPYSETPIRMWNVGIALSVFIIVISLLHALNRLLLRLQFSVEERNRALLNEMTERGRLEREIIDLSEKEKRRFGQELHDVVCQELASVAIASRLLERKLLAMDHQETPHAREIAKMVDDVLERTRSIARGFFTEGFDGAGLAEALRETARHTQEKHGLRCVVRWEQNLTIQNEDLVIHLFRIAQEALYNVVKHANARNVDISLRREGKMLRLIIEDDGIGLAASTSRTSGLGLRIMAYRAGLMSGELKTEPVAGKGTRVICLVPTEKSCVMEMA